MKFRAAFALGAMMILGPGGTQAATLNVPAGHPTISAALETASAGDVIAVAPGYYQEQGLVVPDGVTIEGTGQIPQDVMIDGMGQGRIMLLEGLSQTVTVRNMLFMKGQASGPSSYDGSGGAILVSHSRIRVENCVFSANNAETHGGALRFNGATGEIVSCSFYVNKAPDGGGGALDFSYNSFVQVLDCEFLANRAAWGGAISCRGGSSPRIENSSLTGNVAEGAKGFGGGVFADTQSHPDLLNTLVVENEGHFGGALASWKGGAVNLDYCTVAYNKGLILEGGMLVLNSSPLVTGSIIAFNSGRGVSLAGTSTLEITCTDMYGNMSGDWALAPQHLQGDNGNLNVDPRFCTTQPGHKNRFALASSSQLALYPGDCGVLGSQPVSCGEDKALDEIPEATAAIERVTAAPNPFNPRTTISFEIARSQDVRVAIYGLDGRLVRILSDENLAAGRHELVWQGRDRGGRQVSSGIYFALIKGREETERLKITLLK